MSWMNSRSLWGMGGELRTVARRGRQVWRLIRWRERACLSIALIVMCFSSGANTTIALYLGRLVDAVNPEVNPGLTRDSLTKIAAIYLAVIGLSYLVRETMNVLRRFMVENACTRIDKDVYVRVVSHLMKIELSVLAQDQVGALYGRITRGVDGLVRFMRIGFLDSVDRKSVV